MNKHNLHTHPDMEAKLGVPSGHVIIDREEYHKANRAMRDLAVFKASGKRAGRGWLDLPGLLAERKEMQAEVKRLEDELTKSNQTTRYAGYCCVCALSNLTPDSKEEFDKFTRAAEIANEKEKQ